MDAHAFLFETSRVNVQLLWNIYARFVVGKVPVSAACRDVGAIFAGCPIGRCKNFDGHAGRIIQACQTASDGTFILAATCTAAFDFGNHIVLGKFVGDDNRVGGVRSKVRYLECISVTGRADFFHFFGDAQISRRGRYIGCSGGGCECCGGCVGWSVRVRCCCSIGWCVRIGWRRGFGGCWREGVGRCVGGCMRWCMRWCGRDSAFGIGFERTDVTRDVCATDTNGAALVEIVDGRGVACGIVSGIDGGGAAEERHRFGGSTIITEGIEIWVATQRGRTSIVLD